MDSETWPGGGDVTAVELSIGGEGWEGGDDEAVFEADAVTGF